MRRNFKSLVRRPCVHIFCFAIFFSINTPLQAKTKESPNLSKKQINALFGKKTYSKKEKRQLFVSLLLELKNYSHLAANFKKEDQELIPIFLKFDPKSLDKINEEHLESRYLQFNSKYLDYASSYYRFLNEIKKKRKEKISTPLREKSKIIHLDLKIVGLNTSLNQVKLVLLDLSLEAHKSIKRAFNLFVVKGIGKNTFETPEEQESALDKILGKTSEDTPPSDLPGDYLGSRKSRNALSEEEKINLTPVDSVFYSTQLGKKLEKDLGGKAQYWSYDFVQDELYVKVGNSVGKIRVKEEQNGVRIIQTRVGSNFMDYPTDYQGDEDVDTFTAKGKFLNGKGDTLFGRFPSNDPNHISEEKLKGTGHEGHHDHDGHDH